MKSPTIWQRVTYDLGRELPEELHEWVIRDLVGRGARKRYLIRFLGPIIPFFGLVLLLPEPMLLKIGLIVMMIVPLVVFAVSLCYVWQRFRLVQHGLDPDLVDKKKFTTHDRDMYELHYGHR